MNRSLNIQLLPFLKSASLKRGAIFGSILISALLAFELFNFGTTSFALQDMLGDLKFAGIQLVFHPCLCLLRHGLCRHCPHLHSRAGTRRACRSLVSLWRVAACRGFQRHADLVGCFGCDPQSQCCGRIACRSGCDDQSCADLCGGDGLVDPCFDHWHILCRRRTPLHSCGCRTAPGFLSI